MTDSVETLGVDVRTRVKRLGAKEKARRKKCKVRFSLLKKNEAFQKSYPKVGVKKLLRAGMMPGSTWGRPCSQQQQQQAQRVTTSLSLFMEAYGLEGEEELSTMATQYWAEGFWTG